MWGLYGAFAPCMVYAGFGSSRQLVRFFFEDFGIAAASTLCLNPHTLRC